MQRIDHIREAFTRRQGSGVLNRHNLAAIARHIRFWHFQAVQPVAVESLRGSGLSVPVRAPRINEDWEAALRFTPSGNLELGTTYTYVEGQDSDAGVYLDSRKIAPSKFTAWADYILGDGLSASLKWMKVMSRERFAPLYPVAGRSAGAEAPVEGYDVLNLSARTDVTTGACCRGLRAC
ncbi:hypothetical protein QGM61_03830 [Pseudohongiella sp. SYSU M77423]|uniref:hypothetical protein n=1 Tax=Pseudohongiella sp. SYSU M77423 TaxID=3042312 RepID=UPI0024818ED2|nr:hypothetical protein [Pseudohongiella sp. SYSU M77423]MDH7942942.1 hypothetical protein [Pseudohongiella sp. SYSU M77423]